MALYPCRTAGGGGKRITHLAQGYVMVYTRLDDSDASNNETIRMLNVGTYDLCDDFLCQATAGTWTLYRFTTKKSKKYIIYGGSYNGVNYVTPTIVDLPANAVVTMMHPDVFLDTNSRFFASID